MEQLPSSIFTLHRELTSVRRFLNRTHKFPFYALHLPFTLLCHPCLTVLYFPQSCSTILLLFSVWCLLCCTVIFWFKTLILPWRILFLIVFIYYLVYCSLFLHASAVRISFFMVFCTARSTRRTFLIEISRVNFRSQANVTLQYHRAIFLGHFFSALSIKRKAHIFHKTKQTL